MCKVLKYKSDRSLPSRFRDADCDMGMDILCHLLIKFIQLANLSINMSKFECLNSSIDLLQSFMFQNAMPVDFQRTAWCFIEKEAHWKV